MRKLELSEIKAKYANLDNQDKCTCLNYVAHDLTIFGREFYNSPAQRNLATINEIAHILTGEIAKLLRGDKQHYPDEILIEILFEKNRLFSDASCEQELTRAIRNSFQWLSNYSN